MQLAHPLGVAVGQVVIDRDDMHAVAGQRVEIGGQGRDQRLPFAGTHFGDLAVVKNHAANQLNIEVPHAEYALAGFPDHRERFRQQGVKGFPVGQPGLELDRLAAQLIVGKRADARFQRIDLTDDRGILLDQPIVAAAEYLLE